MTTTALITGANKGIGLETARGLGRLGQTVLIGARDAERGGRAVDELTAEGIDAHLVEIDVSDDASVAAAAADVTARFGRLDVLVNNAGVATFTRERRLPTRADVDDMRAIAEINVYGVIRVTNAFFPLLEASDAPRIVNVSSAVGSMTLQLDPDCPLSSLPASITYPATKAAVNLITVGYAKQLRDTPFKVNAANPGLVASDFNGGHGLLSPAEGAVPSIHLATLGADGPTGVLYGRIWTRDGDGDGGCGILPW